MRDWLDKLLDIPAICSDRTMLHEALANLANRLDFEAFAFVTLRAGENFASSTYALDWQREYQSLDYHQIDPVIRQARRMARAFSWSAEECRHQLSDEERRFFAHAGDHGIASGVSIPVATPNGSMSILTFASSRRSPVKDFAVDAIAAASAVGQLHARFHQLQTSPPGDERFALSTKEAIYCQWLALGKTVEDAADLEGVKYNTVRVALAEARRRYDLCNNTQLVAMAIRHGRI